jgi:hypothetical protein
VAITRLATLTLLGCSGLVLVKEDAPLFPRRSGRYMMHYRPSQVFAHESGHHLGRLKPRNEGAAMSPTDAGRVTDTATSPAQPVSSLAQLATRPLDDDDIFKTGDRPAQGAEFRPFVDPSNYLG